MLYSADLRFCKIPRILPEVETCRYSIEFGVGKGWIGFVTNLNLKENSTQHGWIQTNWKTKKEIQCIKSH